MRIENMKGWMGAMLLCVALTGCDKARDTRIKVGAPAGDVASSLETLGDSVRARAARGDTAGLARLQIGDSLFRRYVYPVSPAYDSTRPEVFRFVLTMHKSNSGKGRGRILHDLILDTALKVVPVAFSESLEIDGARLYTNFRHEGTSGLQPFGSALCRPEGCQVVSYGGAGAKEPVPENP